MSSKTGRGVGRPELYSIDVHQKILQALEVGVPKMIAAHYAGISHITFHEWLRAGRRGEQPYDQLVHDVQVAMAKDAVRNQTSISNAAVRRHEGDWKAAAWNLEKKYPRLYGAAAELLLQLEIEDAIEERRAARAQAEAERPRSPWLQPPTNTTNGRLSARRHDA